jgi:hypothetical protein
MKEKICARISENHEYICETKGIARSGENICTQLELSLDECLCDYWVYIDFTKPDGTTYKTPKLDIVDNKVTYDLPNALLSRKGELKVQAVLQKEDGEIWKSTIKHYTISTSINATDDIPNQEDFITEAQKILNDCLGLDNVLKDILEAIQSGGTTANTIAEIEQLIVSYLETKTVEEVEG